MRARNVDWGLAGRAALVTGGTSGIGAAIARRLADEGCDVTVTGLTREQVETAAADRPRIAAVVLDVADPPAVDRVIGEFSRLDMLINCAGMIERDRREHDPEVFRRVIDVNLNGTMRCCLACRPLLAKSRGCVVNVASMLTFFGAGEVPAYSASKGGIGQLTKSLAIAWAPEGIRVNAIAPGWIETALTEPLMRDASRSRAIVERTPMGRWGRPDDVTGAALFLCCSAAEFVTGVVLPVDGGYSIA